MEFQEVVRRRRMTRDYDPAPLPPGAVDRCLANAVRAPSAGFSQGWAFVVLDTAEDVARFWSATSSGEPDAWRRGMMRAPALIVPCSSKSAYLDRYAEPDKGWTDRDESRWSKPFWDMDVAMAALLILLTAVDEGLGACFFGIPADREGPLRAELGIPDDVDPIGAVTLGRPAGVRGSTGRGARRRPRVPLDQLVHRGSW